MGYLGVLMRGDRADLFRYACTFLLFIYSEVNAIDKSRSRALSSSKISESKSRREITMNCSFVCRSQTPQKQFFIQLLEY